MKRFLSLLLILVCITGFAAAEDLSGLSFDELLALRSAVEREIISRPEWKKVTVPSGTWYVGSDIPAGTYSISATSAGGYIRVKRNGRNIISQGIRDAAHKYGRVDLLDGDVVEIERGSLIFAPAEGLGF